MKKKKTKAQRFFGKLNSTNICLDNDTSLYVETELVRQKLNEMKGE